MASDALLTLATANTIVNTATAPTALGIGPNIQSPVLDLKTIQGTRRSNPLTAYILYTAASATSSGTVLFTVEHSDDNSTWYVLHAADQGPVNLTSTAATGQTWVTIGRSKRYVRLNAYVGGAGATLTISQAVVRMSEP
ncbi:MAG TPA: hypothetical protein VFW40_02725 [Capsulimonadaceae bacterium]|nr:hypothetical protein [Capsulimonadaceae bacterium]